MQATSTTAIPPILSALIALAAPTQLPAQATFGCPVSFPGGPGFIQDIATADVTGDGLLDVVVVGFGFTQGTFLYPNTGASPLLGTPVQITTNSVRQVRLGDLDGDARPDLVLLSSGTLEVHFNTASGFPMLPDRTLARPTGPVTGFTVTDVDGDGDNDVLIGIRVPSSLVVYRFDQGTGMLLPAQTTTTAGSHAYWTFGDVDGDGLPDAVHAANSPDRVRFYKNDSATTAGAFSLANTIVVSNATVRTVALVGQDALVSKGNEAQRYAHLGGFVFSAAETVASVTGFHEIGSFQVADLDLDGDRDALYDQFHPGFLPVQVGLIDSVAGVLQDSVLAVARAPSRTHLADLSGDGLPDLLFTDTGLNGLHVAFNTTGGLGCLPTGPITGNGNGLDFSWTNFFGTALATLPRDVSLGDADDDGIVDLVVASHGQSAMGGNPPVDGRVFILHGTGGGQFHGLVTPILYNTPGVSRARLAEMNMDTRDDLVVLYTGSFTPTPRVDVYHNTTGGLPSAPNQMMPTAAGGLFPQMDVLDIDGNGSPGVIISSPDGTLAAHLGAPGGFLGAATVTATGGANKRWAFGDADGDGVVDAFAVHPGTPPSPMPTAEIWLGNPAAPGSFVLSQTIGLNTLNVGTKVDVQAFDADADGDPDLVVALEFGFDFLVNNGGVFALGMVHVQNTPLPIIRNRFSGTERIVVQDFDQDGDCDIVTALEPFLIAPFRVIENAGVTGMTMNVELPVSLPSQGTLLGSGDVNADTFEDLVFWSGSLGAGTSLNRAGLQGLVTSVGGGPLDTRDKPISLSGLSAIQVGTDATFDPSVAGMPATILISVGASGGLTAQTPNLMRQAWQEMSIASPFSSPSAPALVAGDGLGLLNIQVLPAPLFPLFATPLRMGDTPFIVGVSSSVLSSLMSVGDSITMQAVFFNPVSRNAHTFGLQATNTVRLIAVP